MRRLALVVLMAATCGAVLAQPAPEPGSFQAELGGGLTSKPAGPATLSLRKDGAGTLALVQGSEQMMAEAAQTSLTIRLPSAQAPGSWTVGSYDPTLDARAQIRLKTPQAYLSHEQLKTHTLHQLTKVETGTVTLSAVSPYSGTFEIRFAADPAKGLNAPVTVKGRFAGAQAVEAAH